MEPTAAGVRSLRMRCCMSTTMCGWIMHQSMRERLQHTMGNDEGQSPSSNPPG